MSRFRNKEQAEPEFGICGTCALLVAVKLLIKLWVQKRRTDPSYAEAEVMRMYLGLMSYQGPLDTEFPHEDFCTLLPEDDLRVRWRSKKVRRRAGLSGDAAAAGAE